jgi:neutral ceramidase
MRTAAPRARGWLRPAIVAGALLLITSPSCALTMPGASPPDPAPAAPVAPARLEVGAARVDITPHPGFSMFGHGPDSRVASGYWSRLECRAFYFETNAPGFVIVSCDLQSISTLLQRRAAALVKAPIPASRLMLTATHTHTAPAHYLDATLYNDLTSTRFPGYDEGLVTMLSERIADAVDRAYDARRPARVRWAAREVWGLTRNRSLAPFDGNARGPRPIPPAVLALPSDQCAIDPALRVLEIDEAEGGDGGNGADGADGADGANGADGGANSPPSGPGDERRRPIGSIAFFAMHPSVLSPTNHLFSGDTHGVAVRVVERELRRQWGASDPSWSRCVDRPVEDDPARALAPKCPDPVHAIINTNEGDMVPVYAAHTTDEAIRVGELLGAAIIDAGRAPAAEAPAASEAPPVGPGRRITPWKRTIPLDLRYLEVDLPGAGFRGSRIQLCGDAEIGVGVTLGGSDHPSSLVPLMQTNILSANFDLSHCQAPKSSFIRGGRYGLPTHVPLGLLRIDGTWISFIPAEMTITAGARLNDVVRGFARLSDPQADAVVAGLSNGYIEYVATREEYQLQHYEGASTLYGPATAEFLAAQLGVLAMAMRGVDVTPHLRASGPRLGEAVAFDYKVGPSRESIDPDFPRSRVGAGAPVDLCRASKPRRPRLCFSWTDVEPQAVPIRDAPWVEIVRDGGDPERRRRAGDCDSLTDAPCAASIDDRGIAFMTRARSEHGGGLWLWSTVFTPSAADWERIEALGAVRIRARGAGSRRAVESAAFTTESLPRMCTPEEAVRCGF